MRARYLLILTTVLLLGGCESFNDCVRESMRTAKDDADQKFMNQMCIKEHERSLGPRVIGNIEFSAELTPHWQNKGFYYLRLFLHNPDRRYVITRVTVKFQTKKYGKLITATKEVGLRPEKEHSVLMGGGEIALPDGEDLEVDKLELVEVLGVRQD